MGALIKKLRFDSVTVLCCLLCSGAFVFWMHAVEGGIHLAAVLFLILLPVTFFCLGDALLRWLKFPIRSAHPFPLAFLSGGVLAMLLLFVIHLVIPLPLWLVFLLVALASLTAYGLAPAREFEATSDSSGSWKIVLAMFLSLVAATFWTQELRPGTRITGDEVALRPFGDYVIFAQFAGQLHHNASLTHLGDPDLAGLHLPIYHFASFVLPASLEAWSPTTSAFDTTMALWVPFSFFLVGLSAFCLAAEWFGDLAGIAATCAVLLIPSPPAYMVPIHYLSFHWVITSSPGLAYGIAGAVAGLVILSAALRTDRMLLFVAGFGLVVSSVLLKAHIALVAVPLAVAWVLCLKKGLSRRKRLVLFLISAIGSYAVLRMMDHLKIGPNILPNGTPGSFLDEIPGWLHVIRYDYWPHLLMHHVFFTKHGYPIALTTIVVTTELGIWLFLGGLLGIKSIFARRCQPLDLLTLLAIPIYFFYTFISPPNTRTGTVNEMWHRPFVWCYFLLAVWITARFVSWLEKSWPHRSMLTTVGTVGLSILLLVTPFKQGKSIQHAVPAEKFTDVRLNVGFMACADFVRNHAKPTDVVQNESLSYFPFLSAFSERRAYLGREPEFWKEYSNGTPAMTESQRRSEVLKNMRDARTSSDLQAFARTTGIRWYVARPSEELAWPKSVLDRPAFASDGFSVYDLNDRTPIK